MTDGLLEQLTKEACLQLLREGSVGRIALVIDGDPIILPVNYRLAEPPSGPLLAVRTRPGNVIDQAPESVAFEIDSIDRVNHAGWSVLVRGELLHASSSSPKFREIYDPASWLEGRDAWLLIDPWAISGRALRDPEQHWPIGPSEYV